MAFFLSGVGRWPLGLLLGGCLPARLSGDHPASRRPALITAGPERSAQADSCPVAHADASARHVRLDINMPVDNAYKIDKP
jgi:hypothetical protein